MALSMRATHVRVGAPVAAARRTAAARPAVPAVVRQARPLQARRLAPLRVIKESGAVKGQPSPGGSDDEGKTRDAWDPDWEENATSEVPGESCDIQSCAIEPVIEPVENYEPKDDLFKAVGVFAALLVVAGALQYDWVGQNEGLALSVMFCFGYAGIIFEEFFAFNKAGVALLTAVAMWTIRSTGTPAAELNHQLGESLSDVSQIIFFLIGAMTVVEVVDAHQGFKIVTDAITTRDKKKLLWLIGGITFCMSAILDNLTSTIVMVSLLRKLVKDKEQRRYMGAVVVIAANAGGAWTPIGDVTTTMLWINGQISAVSTMRDILFPALAALVVPLALLSGAPEFQSDEKEQSAAKAEAARAAEQREGEDDTMAPRGQLVFAAGVGSLVFVPVFKQLTGLPPFLGMLLGLGGLWVLTDAVHYGEPQRQRLKVGQALSRIDTQGVLFFLGILMSVSAMSSMGLLKELAVALNEQIPDIELVAVIIGLVSAAIDNVPLVAATMGMYDLEQYPMDNPLWQLIAYCAGTGGSILIIGSAAGVAFMGMEKADFMWYVRKVSPFAMAGYLSGIGVYTAGHFFAGHSFAAVAATMPVVAPQVLGSLPM